MRNLTIFCIRAYQQIFSKDQGFFVKIGLRRRGNICVFYPTCSEYAVLAVKKYGVIRGVDKSLWRILRCHPWQKNHIDMP